MGSTIKTIQGDEIFPSSKAFRPLKDIKGNTLPGNKVLLEMGEIIKSYEDTTHRAFPNPIPEFIRWVKEACKSIENGEDSKEFYAKTIAKNGFNYN